MNDLISVGEISDRRKVLGLYVIGRPDPEVRQLENAVVAEQVSDKLRIYFGPVAIVASGNDEGVRRFPRGRPDCPAAVGPHD